jgi:hypothetical protein|tara:strand:+ start:535 stop:651 length:117 start_codon:yes stop_codon:yes gene_type:complete
LKFTKFSAKIESSLNRMIDMERVIGVGKKLLRNDAAKE